MRFLEDEGVKGQGFSLTNFFFPHMKIIRSLLHTHLYPHTSLSRRNKTQSLGILQKHCAFHTLLTFGFCNGDEMCLLRGTGCKFICNSGES